MYSRALVSSGSAAQPVALTLPAPPVTESTCPNGLCLAAAALALVMIAVAAAPTPIEMTGWVDGSSQRMITFKEFASTATQPAVGWPLVTCRKNAEPAPARTGNRL